MDTDLSWSHYGNAQSSLQMGSFHWEPWYRGLSLDFACHVQMTVHFDGSDLAGISLWEWQIVAYRETKSIRPSRLFSTGFRLTADIWLFLILPIQPSLFITLCLILDHQPWSRATEDPSKTFVCTIFSCGLETWYHVRSRTGSISIWFPLYTRCSAAREADCGRIARDVEVWWGEWFEDDETLIHRDDEVGRVRKYFTRLWYWVGLLRKAYWSLLSLCM